MQRRVCNIESVITFARKAENLMFTYLYCYVIYVLYFSLNFPDPLLQQNYLASKIKPLGKGEGVHAMLSHLDRIWEYLVFGPRNPVFC